MHLKSTFRFRCLTILTIAFSMGIIWRYGVLPLQREQAAHDYVISRGGYCVRNPTFPPVWMAWLNPFRLATSITGVSLHHDEIDERVVQHLRDFRDVELMYLCGPYVTDDSLREIAKLPIQELHLNASRVTDEGVAVLTRIPTIRELQLNGTCITDDGITELMKLPNLERLTVADTKVSDAGILQLRRIQRLRRLRVSEIVTQQAIEQLEASLPNCRISR